MPPRRSVTGQRSFLLLRAMGGGRATVGARAGASCTDGEQHAGHTAPWVVRAASRGSPALAVSPCQELRCVLIENWVGHAVLSGPASRTYMARNCLQALATSSARSSGQRAAKSGVPSPLRRLHLRQQPKKLSPRHACSRPRRPESPSLRQHAMMAHGPSTGIRASAHPLLVAGRTASARLLGPPRLMPPSWREEAGPKVKRLHPC